MFGQAFRVDKWIVCRGLAAERIGGMAVVPEVGLIWRLVVEARMRAAAIVEIEIAPDPVTSRADAVVGVQVDLLVRAGA